MLPRLLTIPFSARSTYGRQLLGFLFGTLLALLFFNLHPVSAATVTVTNTNDSGPGSLRQHITTAAPGDTLLFDASLSGQTIVLNSPLTITQQITIDGSALTSALTLSGNRVVRVMAISPDIHATVIGLTIADGYSTAGGGLYNQGTATLSGVHFYRNKARSGGGIYNSHQLTINNSLFHGNQANGENWWFGAGGGITNQHQLIVQNSTFSENWAYFGAGIDNGGRLTITHSTFGQNMAAYGGGLSSNGEALLVKASAFISNQAHQMGGGIYTNNTSAIHSSTFIGNKAWIGSAIRYFANTVVTNSTFQANTGSTITNGGAMRAFGELWLYNSTLIGNEAPYGAVAAHSGFHLYHTIIGHSLGRDCGSTPDTNINNLIMDGSCGATLTGDPRLGPLHYVNDVPQAFVLLPGSPAIDAGDNATCLATDQAGNARPTDGNGDGTVTCDIGAFERQPLTTTSEIYLRGNGAWIDNGDRIARLVNHTDFGQPPHPQGSITHTFVISNMGAIDLSAVSIHVTGTHAADFQVVALPASQLTAGSSSAFQIVFHAAVLGERQATVEVRSNAHPVPLYTFAIAGRACRAALTVTTNADVGPGSLRQALDDLCSGGLITFADQMTRQTIALEEQLTLAKNLTVDGATPPVALTISGQDDVRVFMVNADVTATLNRLIIAHGRAPDGKGGGIQNLGSLTVTNSTLLENHAPGYITDGRYPPNAMGGALFNGGQLFISNSSFISNTIAKASGIGLGGAIYNNSASPINIRHSTFSDNRASQGGSIAGPLILDNSLVTDSNESDDCWNTLPLTGTNLIADGSCGATRTGDPMLGPLQDNGGGILTQELLPGSPAIDAADAAACPSTDQRGIARPLDGNGDGFAVCDLGAVEAPAVATPTPIPTATATPTPTITPTATGTPTPPAVNTVAPLPPPTPTATPTSERPPCPRGAAVEPLLSPTDQLSQTIVVNAPAAATVQVNTISGTFDAVTTDPYQVPITLLPNQRHPLTVTLAYGRLGGSPPSLCQEVRTVDKRGAPLIIVQQPLPTPVPTAPPQPTPHTVYLPLIQSQ